MKHNLKNAPKDFSTQTYDKEMARRITEFYEWFEGFEKELREGFKRNTNELKQLDELHSVEARAKKHFIHGWQFALKEILGDS